MLFVSVLLLTANMLSLGKWNLFPNEHMSGTEAPHHQQGLGLLRVVQHLQGSMGVILCLTGRILLGICQTHPRRSLQKH